MLFVINIFTNQTGSPRQHQPRRARAEQRPGGDPSEAAAGGAGRGGPALAGGHEQERDAARADREAGAARRAQAPHHLRARHARQVRIILLLI